MKLSLIVTSCDRQPELDRFSLSLSQQTFAGDVEVIFVAQGRAEFRLISPGNTNIRLIERRVRGRISLSKARNIGIKEASGDVVGFPDDDCWYEPDLLAGVVEYYMSHPNVDCICANVYDPESSRPLGGYRPRGLARRVTYWNIFRLGNSNGIFVRNEALKRTGELFDERLGVGTKIGSGEEVEFLGRILDAGCTIEYLDRLSVYHEVRDNQVEGIDKVFNYAVGFGYVNGSFLRRGHVQVLAFLAEVVTRSSGGIVLYFLVRERRVLWIGRLRGITRGFIAAIIGSECSKNSAMEADANS